MTGRFDVENRRHRLRLRDDLSLVELRFARDDPRAVVYLRLVSLQAAVRGSGQSAELPLARQFHHVAERMRPVSSDVMVARA